MAYVLGNDIVGADADLGLFERKWREYHDYLESVRGRMPLSAFEFATAPWHYNFADHRSLHDSWVDALVISEPARGDRHEIRSLEIEVRLLAPYHDGITTLKYRGVVSYSLDAQFVSSPRGNGHGDWLGDELRLSTRGSVLHEIEFRHGSRWIIECEDIEWLYTPQQ